MGLVLRAGGLEGCLPGLSKSFGGSTRSGLSVSAPLAVLVRHGLRVLAWQQAQRRDELISANGNAVSVLVRPQHHLENSSRILVECC
jgi:hypothetical protein